MGVGEVDSHFPPGDWDVPPGTKERSFQTEATGDLSRTDCCLAVLQLHFLQGRPIDWSLLWVAGDRQPGR